MIANALKRSDGNINYPGLIAAWSAKGKTNDDADRAILKDLTGNGHDITLNGFTFSKMSGYGGYPIDFKTEYAPALKINRVSGTLTSSKITITSVKELNNFLESDRIEKHKSYKIKVTGVNDDLYIRYFYSATEYYNIKTEGIHVLPEFNEVQFVGFRATKVSDSCNIIIELIPEYPDALVFDGIDDYGFCKNIPLLKDYTIIAKRKDCNGGCLFNKGVNTRGAFILEGFGFTSNTYNFGQGQNKNLLNNDIITWQNKNSYNQQSLIIGNDLDSTNQIIIGKLIDTDTRILKGAFYSAYLFDRSLDEQEIKAFIRKYIDPEYLLPSEIPTPDCYYDLSQGSNDDETRETIKDYSGNGNDAVAHNFGWNEEGSGYKDGALYFDGTDDYVSLDAFDSGFKTVFILCSWHKFNLMNYDQRKDGTSQENALNTHEFSICYVGRNVNGKTYLNGKLNTTIKASSTINKKHLITAILKAENNTMTPVIGSTCLNKGLYSNITLYKFLGFKEALTEEQIQAVIKKYNLLDGVDEIEVS